MRVQLSLPRPLRFICQRFVPAAGPNMIYERCAEYAERKATEFNIDGMGKEGSVGEEVAAGGRPFRCA